MNSKLKLYLHLFLTFFKIGAFTFGGGYAMIPLINSETVVKNKWITDKDILDIVAIAESTPGPIAINSATFVALPSFIIIYIISFVLEQFESIKTVKYAFNGIRAGVLALLIKALITMYKECPKGKLAYVIMAGAFICSVVFDINALIIIAVCAVLGILSAVLASRKENEK